MKSDRLNRKTIREKVVFTLVFLLFSIYALSIVYMLYWALISSLKSNVDYYQNTFSLPKVFQIENYFTAFKELSFNGVSLITMFFNSVWLSFGSAFVNVFTSAMMAYVVAKYKFKGREFLYSVAIFSITVPIIGSLPSSIKVLSFLHIIDTPFMLLTFVGGFGFNFIVLNGFFKNLSMGFAEAAFIDGAGHFRTFFQIMLPQSIAQLFALGILHVIATWNDYMFPLIYLSHFPTLSSGLFLYQTAIEYTANYPVYFAGILIAVFPILIIFIFFQNTIMDNISMGGLKE